MPITPQGIWYPGSSDDVTPLETTFSAMASSIDNILSGDVQIHRVANTTERNALVSQYPPSASSPLFVWRANATNGRELEYTKDGTNWYYINTSEDDTGWVNLTLENGWTVSAGRTPQVRRIGNIVQMQGRVEGGSGNVATLPPQFRPPQSHSFIVRDGGTTNSGPMAVSTNGGISTSSVLSQPNLLATWFVG